MMMGTRSSVARRGAAYLLLTGALALGACSSPTDVAPGGTVDGVVQSRGVEIRWYLDLPDGTGPFPTVVYGNASGHISANWDRTIGHARELNALGFAVMRYDKRGMGGSGGDVQGLSVANSEAMVDSMAADMLAVLGEALAHPDVDANRVGFFGLSQAAFYMPYAAAQSPAVRFVGVISGGVASVGIQTRFETLTQYDPANFTSAETALRDFDGPAGYDPLPLIRDSSVPFLYLIGRGEPFTPYEYNSGLIDELIQMGRAVRLETYESILHGLDDVPFWLDVGRWLNEIGA